MMPKIQNETGTDLQGVVSIYFEDLTEVGSYHVPLNVKPGASRSLNLQQLANSGLPDAEGHLLPAGLTSGMLVLEAESGPVTVRQAMSAECPMVCALGAQAGPALVANSQTQFHFATHKVVSANSTVTAACAPPPPTCPQSVFLAGTTTFDLTPFVPGLKMGIGIAATMQVGSVVEQWDGTKITESVTEFSNTCPRKIFKGVCEGSSTFTVGASGGTAFGKPFPSAHNTFYDFHTGTSTISLLDQAGLKGCTAVCKQTYSCGGNVIGNFTISRVFRKAVINGTHVTTITTTKK
jgi:hypothetical protein